MTIDRNTLGNPYDILHNPSSAIWDSRAPYATFLEKHERINQSYRLTRIAYRLMEATCAGLPPDSSLTDVLVPLLAGRGNKQDIRKYESRSPHIKNVLDDLTRQYTLVDETVMLRNTSLFEAYSLSWCCNMLLATLENNYDLSREQKEITVCVVQKGRLPFPRRVSGKNGRFYANGLSQIIHAFPKVRNRLTITPRRKKHPQTQRKEPPAYNEVNALEVIEFWQDVRNLVIHNERIVTDGFVKKRSAIWDVLRSDLSYVPPIRVNHPLPLNTPLIAASLTTHALLAREMRDVLIQYSRERRGHVFAPGPFRGALSKEEMPSRIPSLILPEDRPRR